MAIAGEMRRGGSVGDHLTPPLGGPLGSSKAAFASMSAALRLKLRPQGIEVCVIEPGSINTPAHDPENGSITQQVRKQQYPVIGSGAGVFSFVHVQDAASATVAALESDPGVYNVVDDDPSEMNVWLPAFARFVGAPPPLQISEGQAQSLGADPVYYATRLRGAQNGLAKRKLGFAPRKLEWLSKT